MLLVICYKLQNVGAAGCSWEQFPGGLGGYFGKLGES